MLSRSELVGDLPRVKDPADKVVDRLGLREGLVTTFMCDNPDAGTKKTGEERVECPDRELDECVKVWARKGDVFWSDQRVEIFGCLPGNTDSGQVTDTMVDRAVVRRGTRGVAAKRLTCIDLT